MVGIFHTDYLFIISEIHNLFYRHLKFICWSNNIRYVSNQNIKVPTKYFFVSVTLFGSSWHVANSAIISSYRAFSKEKIQADLGVHVGLRHVNITLQGKANTK